jgi:release factor glutamine methyltransferase
LLVRHTKDLPSRASSIYPPREDTALLLPFATGARGGWLLDVGTGNGALALAAARQGVRVVATDLNGAALAAVAATARREGLPLVAVRTDLTDGVRPVDRLVCNPPYLPTTPGAEDPDRGADLALNGGPDGCRVTARLVLRVSRILRPRGRAYILESTLQSRARLAGLRDRFHRGGGRVRRVAVRPLEGETLEVWEWTPKVGLVRRAARRTGRSTRGTGVRRRAPPPRRPASSRGPAPGRRPAPGGASTRRRSPRGS